MNNKESQKKVYIVTEITQMTEEREQHLEALKLPSEYGWKGRSGGRKRMG